MERELNNRYTNGSSNNLENLENKSNKDDDELDDQNNDTKIDKFLYDYKNQISDDEDSNDSYEKRLDKEIEDNCDFKVYVDKLEVDEKNDEEVLNMEKPQIIEFKNSQIKKYKAYIASLEQEKQDLIDNFKETTSILLEKIKEHEEKTHGERPQTAVIMDGIKKNKGKRQITQLQPPNYFGTSDKFDDDIDGEIDKIILSNYNKDKNNISKDKDEPKVKSTDQERCVKCKKYYPKDEFAKHSLECLRKPMIVCKICHESIDEKCKDEHINKFRKPETIISSIEEKNLKLFENCLNHGFDVEKTCLDTEKGYLLIHYICENAHSKFLNIYIKKNLKTNVLLTTINKEPPIVSLNYM